MDSLYIGADNEVFYDNVSLQDGTALTTGTCTYELKTYGGASLSPPVTGTLTGSGNDYTGVIESSVATSTALSDGAQYRLEITFVQGVYNDFRRIPVQACYRGKG